MSEQGEWFESFFGELYGKVLAVKSGTPKTVREAGLIRRLLGLRKGDRVLDVPCGMGRLTVPLAGAGMEVTGVDLSAAYLRQARASARQAGVAARFLRRDMRRIELDGQFHAAFNWFTSIGYFSEEEELDFCRRVLAALKPGGRFLVETLHKPWILTRFLRRACERIGDVQIFHRNRWDAATSRTEDVWTFRHKKKMEQHRISVRLYDGRELKALLGRAGFEAVRLYGNPPLGPLTRRSRRLIAVARRPA